jgi:hypothetical protein
LCYNYNIKEEIAIFDIVRTYDGKALVHIENKSFKKVLQARYDGLVIKTTYHDMKDNWREFGWDIEIPQDDVKEIKQLAKDYPSERKKHNEPRKPKQPATNSGGSKEKAQAETKKQKEKATKRKSSTGNGKRRKRTSGAKPKRSDS